MLLAGCAKPPKITVESRYDDGLELTLRRVFVVLDTRELDRETTPAPRTSDAVATGVAQDFTCFADVFVPAMAAAFDSVGVDTGFYRLTGIELSEAAFREPAERLGADAILWVKERYMETLTDVGYFGLFSSSEITDVDLGAYIEGPAGRENPPWQAVVIVDEGSGGWKVMASRAASELVAMLVDDGLIK